MTEEKIKVLTISDHILSPSGVALQTRYMIDYLYKTGKYQFICLGGAIKHADYRPQKVDIYGDDLIIYPVDGYGTQDIVRMMLDEYRPDILWFMTDPRFYEWLWEMDDEIRANVPMVYHHVWDNYPYPKFNRGFYLSNDVIATISKLTDDIVREVAPEVRREYIPHSVDMQTFKKLPEEQVSSFKKKTFGDKTLFFWNSRNARRKMSGSVVWWFSEFLEEVGSDKACLLMHTDPKDPNGQDLEAIIAELGLVNGEVRFSKERSTSQEMALLYNIADCTICVSDAEGFGLSCMESLACETPVIANMTGGLQEQVYDGKEYFGIGIKPASKAIIGSQQVPYIYEDRISKEDFIRSLHAIHNIGKEARDHMGKKGRQHLEKNYNPEVLLKKWDTLFTDLVQTQGSWEKRNTNKWTLDQI